MRTAGREPPTARGVCPPPPPRDSGGAPTSLRASGRGRPRRPHGGPRDRPSSRWEFHFPISGRTERQMRHRGLILAAGAENAALKR